MKRFVPFLEQFLSRFEGEKEREYTPALDKKFNRVCTEYSNQIRIFIYLFIASGMLRGVLSQKYISRYRYLDSFAYIKSVNRALFLFWRGDGVNRALFETLCTADTGIRGRGGWSGPRRGRSRSQKIKNTKIKAKIA